MSKMDKLLDDIAKRSLHQGFELGVRKMVEALVPLAQDRRSAWKSLPERAAAADSPTGDRGGTSTTTLPMGNTKSHADQVKGGVAAAIARFEARAERRERGPRGRG